MGRPETISCERCQTSVVVKAKGPVPSFCADCRRKRSRNGKARPSVIACERCGSEVIVQARGPLPRFCRDGCRPASHRNGRDATAAAASNPPVAVAAGPSGLRPWDHAATTRRATGPRRPPQSTTTTTTTTTTEGRPHPATPAFGPPKVTRIDVIHPDAIVDRADIGRRLRVRRLKRAASIAAWIAVVIIIALIFFAGSQPASPELDSVARFIT